MHLAQALGRDAQRHHLPKAHHHIPRDDFHVRRREFRREARLPSMGMNVSQGFRLVMPQEDRK
jgi:hypothetical protein